MKQEATTNQHIPLPAPQPQNDNNSESQQSEVEDDFGGGALFDGVELATDPDDATEGQDQGHTPCRGGAAPVRPGGVQRHASEPVSGTTQPNGHIDTTMPPPPNPASRASTRQITTSPQANPPGSHALQKPDHKLSSSNVSGLAHQPNVERLDTPGFVTSRAAMTSKDEPLSDRQIVSLPRFNPTAESPSIKRTPGIDHNTSSRVERKAVNTLPAPGSGHEPTKYPSMPTGANGAGQKPQHIPQQSHPQGVNPSIQNRPHGTTPTTVQTPHTPNNYLNPTADPGRRVGMPATRNGSPYKPPGGVKRPLPSEAAVSRTPLADVSNTVTDASRGGGIKEETSAVRDTHVKRPRLGDEA